jgi:hypothetical protein
VPDGLFFNGEMTYIFIVSENQFKAFSVESQEGYFIEFTTGKTSYASISENEIFLSRIEDDFTLTTYAF